LTSKVHRNNNATKIWQPNLCNLYNYEIGRDCSIGAFCEISGAAIGNRVKIQAFCFIPPGIVIKNDVFIGPRVTFTNDNYPPSHGTAWQQTIVEDFVSIGAGAIILPGVTLGEGSRIGAGAVVTRDVAPHTTVAGNPARVMEKDIG
jgi:UDP-2-acetamido-3-amino-2,3-dideoxy-glucuronate N-acetyltransferase